MIAPTAPLRVFTISGWGFRPDALHSFSGYLPAEWDIRALSAFSLLREADPVAALANELAASPRPPLVVGWSMGGMLALTALAEGAPAAGLVLFGSTPRFCEAEDYLCGTPVETLRAMKLAARRNPGELLATFTTACATTPEGPAALATLTDPDHALLGRGLDYLITTDLREKLSGVTTPTLILHGKTDRIVPVNASHELHRRLPGSELVRLEGVGHDLPVCAARLCAGYVREFAGRRLPVLPG